jgi:PAS domain S-box-containing protein
MKVLQCVLRGEQPPVVELRVLSRSGAYISAEFCAAPHSHGGNVIGVLGIARDITEDKRAAEALRQSEQRYRISEDRYRELFEHANDIVFTIDLAGNFTSVNRAAEQLTGYMRDETPAMNFTRIVAPEYLGLVREMLARKIAGGEPTTYELEIITKGRQRVPLEVSTRLIYQDGKAVGVQGIARDVTERKQAEEALRQSEYRYRILVESARDVIFTLSTEGRFTSLNPVFETLTGWSPGEWLGKHVADMIHPEDGPGAMKLFQGFLRGDRLPSYELRVLTKSGEYRTGEVTATLEIRDGEVVGVLGIARDITERKRAEEALRRLNEMLEERAKRIAHALHDEAGQVLASVYLAVAELARELPPAARARLGRISQLLDRVDEQLRHLSHELRPTILDDLGVLPALEFLVEGVSKRTGLRITVEGSTEGRLSPPTETAVYRIVQEALSNVAKHAQATRVSVRLRREGNGIRCSVTDDGIGFDVPGVLARRGERGLGLIGIQERLQTLGGALEIRSASGRGTELLITLPLKT